MRPPFKTALTRASRTASSISHTQLRGYSQQVSPTGAFYKTFTRPVAKCALLAVFVYQIVYFGWTRLEVDEIKEERQAEITRLEVQVKSLQAAQAAAAAAAAAASDKNKAESGSEGVKANGGSWWPWK
ncbi:hypothetical protein VTI74DRAFT_8056 [Chaetomium olivicolor]